MKTILKNKGLKKQKAMLRDSVKNYGNDPFFVKKATGSKVFLERHGFPKQLIPDQ